MHLATHAKRQKQEKVPSNSKRKKSSTSSIYRFFMKCSVHILVSFICYLYLKYNSYRYILFHMQNNCTLPVFPLGSTATIPSKSSIQAQYRQPHPCQSLQLLTNVLAKTYLFYDIIPISFISLIYFSTVVEILPIFLFFLFLPQERALLKTSTDLFFSIAKFPRTVSSRVQ